MPPLKFPGDDPATLAALSPLGVSARRIVEGFMLGQHQSPFKGSSVEFVEHRQYAPGDEIRHIDWRAYGKTGKYYVKEFEEETNLQAIILLDVSGSMAFGKSTLSKLDYGKQLAAVLASLLQFQRDAVGLVTFDAQLRHRVEPAVGLRQFAILSQQLQEAQPGNEGSLGRFLQTFVPTLKRRSLIILISDGFDELDSLRSAFQLFSRRQHDLMLFQVLAPEELTFPFTRPTRFRNLERRSQQLLVDPARLRSQYLQQFEAFQKQLHEMAGRSGWDLLQLTTTDDFRHPLGTYLDLRNRRSRRRGRSPG